MSTPTSEPFPQAVDRAGAPTRGEAGSTDMNILTAALDLILPQPCAGCGTPRGLICPACEEALVKPARLCLPSPVPSGLPPPFAVAPYAGAVRQLIVAHKERGLTGLARPLGAALARAALAATDSAGMGTPIVLVPVPSSRVSVRRRGHDPTLRIAQEAAEEATRETAEVRSVVRVPIRRAGHRSGKRATVSCVPALAHQRRVADQAGLTAADRTTNLAGALRARLDLHGVRAIIVDDVVTSGSTLTEAARALRAAGAEVPAAAVIAATERHTGGPFSSPTPRRHEGVRPQT
jgi:predicted amidophosphoribosyltransferase